jgi:endogenous inhibitor of DNA gyrase (YacG/DUF329 family)
VNAVTPSKPCPICGKPAEKRFAPFCSQRCADVDLQSWLTGRYAVPVEPDEEEDAIDTSPSDPAGQRRRDFL